MASTIIELIVIATLLACTLNNIDQLKEIMTMHTLSTFVHFFVHYFEGLI